VYARATRIACIVASVPDTVMRALPIQPVSCFSSSIASISSSDVSEKLTPRRIRKLTWSSTRGSPWPRITGP
jgi:hypothetical protein